MLCEIARTVIRVSKSDFNKLVKKAGRDPESLVPFLNKDHNKEANEFIELYLKAMKHINECTEQKCKSTRAAMNYLHEIREKSKQILTVMNVVLD